MPNLQTYRAQKSPVLKRWAPCRANSKFFFAPCPRSLSLRTAGCLVARSFVLIYGKFYQLWRSSDCRDVLSIVFPKRKKEMKKGKRDREREEAVQITAPALVSRHIYILLSHQLERSCVCVCVCGKNTGG